jgi:hypothetical protein
LKKLSSDPSRIEEVFRKLNSPIGTDFVSFPSPDWPSHWRTFEEFMAFWNPPEGPGDGSSEGWIHIFRPPTLIGRVIEERMSEGYQLLGIIYLTSREGEPEYLAHAIMVPRSRGEDAERFRRPDPE